MRDGASKNYPKDSELEITYNAYEVLKQRYFLPSIQQHYRLEITYNAYEVLKPALVRP